MTGGGCGDGFEYGMNKLEARTGCFKWILLALVFVGHFTGWTKKEK